MNELFEEFLVGHKLNVLSRKIYVCLIYNSFLGHSQMIKNANNRCLAHSCFSKMTKNSASEEVKDMGCSILSKHRILKSAFHSFTNKM